MPEMPDNLIILGAGATAAIAAKGHGFPTAKDFFDAGNTEWSSSQPRYPHLSSAYSMVRRLEANNQVGLTQVWLFVDTLLKYHSALRSRLRSSLYDRDSLRKRYENDEGLLPDYLKPGYLNAHSDEFFHEMRPLFSTAENYIYRSFPCDDPVNYFLVLAGWELKHLILRTYCPEKPTHDTYEVLLDELQKNSIPVSVINFNWDIYFEQACRKQGQGIQIVSSADHYDAPTAAIALCKPHGGWNVQHVTDYLRGIDEAKPFESLEMSVNDSDFDRTYDREIRPAMIPYFASPDEIKKEHEALWPSVGEYFMNQQCAMKRHEADVERRQENRLDWVLLL